VTSAQPVTVIEASRGQPPMRLRELWEARELLYFFVWRDVKVRYKQTFVGIGWAVIQPLFMMALFTLFFGILAGISTEGLPGPVFYLTGLVPWTFFSAGVSGAAGSMVENQGVITKVYFPRLILPLASVLGGLVDFGIAFVLLLAVVFGYGIVPSLTVFLVPVFVALLMLTALGAGLWLSALNAMYRDVRYTVPFLLQLWLFASPVVYPASQIPEPWRAVYGLNPMAGVIEGFRWALLGRGQPPDLLLAVSAAAVLVLVFGGLRYFRRVEGHVVDVV
jgi:lipopolysaccharide transport system permease protein